MFNVQDLDRLVRQAKALWNTDSQAIADDPKLIDELRARWAESVKLEAVLRELAFEPADNWTEEDGAEGARNWARRLETSLKRRERLDDPAAWDTSRFGSADEDPLAWMLVTMPTTQRLASKLDEVTELLRREAIRR